MRVPQPTLSSSSALSLRRKRAEQVGVIAASHSRPSCRGLVRSASPVRLETRKAAKAVRLVLPLATIRTIFLQ